MARMNVIKRMPKDDPADVISESLKPWHRGLMFRIFRDDNTEYAHVVNGEITFNPDKRVNGYMQ